MYLYGSALIGVCLIAGNLMGLLLGKLTGLGSNIGGVGFASVLLILYTAFRPVDRMHPKTVAGIKFWQGMFLPVVVALSASQDVVHALDGGMVALLAGLLPVAAGFALMSVFKRVGKNQRGRGGEALLPEEAPHE